MFDRANPPAADAEVFAKINDALYGRGLRPRTGDMGLLKAAVRGLSTSERRKSALLRHIWRPVRFRALLDRFAGMVPVPESRAKLLLGAVPLMPANKLIGLRTDEEISERIEALRQDAKEAPIAANEVALLDRILSLRARLPEALLQLRDIAKEMPVLEDTVSTFDARIGALEKLGVDVANLEFSASYGRSSMEYYDGFVFGFHADASPDLPPVATGGRYDALTRVLGQGKSIPAVGGVIRPALLLEVST